MKTIVTGRKCRHTVDLKLSRDQINYKARFPGLVVMLLKVKLEQKEMK